MKKPRICRKCKHCDYNDLKIWCSYWKIEIGKLAATNGCERWESND